MIVFFNGKFMPEAEAVVPLNDRGLLYGDGLFETMRVVNGRPFRLAQHLERFQRGADFLKITLPLTPKEIQKIGAQLIEKNGLPECMLRVMVTRGSGERGYTPRAATQPTLAITVHPLPAASADASLQWRMVTSPHQVPANDAVAGFKTSNKLLHVLARLDAQERGAEEALLLNTNGEVAEAAGGNVFWIYQNRVCTVPTGRGVLPGITRAVVLEICQSLGLETNKRVVKPSQLQRSEGIFVTQSIFGIVPIAEFDGQPVTPSPLVDQIASAYSQTLIAESEHE